MVPVGHDELPSVSLSVGHIHKHHDPPCQSGHQLFHYLLPEHLLANSCMEGTSSLQYNSRRSPSLSQLCRKLRSCFTSFTGGMRPPFRQSLFQYHTDIHQVQARAILSSTAPFPSPRGMSTGVVLPHRSLDPLRTSRIPLETRSYCFPGSCSQPTPELFLPA